jgi:hypothetical protein
VSAGVKALGDMKEKLDREGSIDYDHVLDIHLVAGVLKHFLIEMPEPLLTHALYLEFIAAADQKDDKAKANASAKLMTKLPSCNFGLASALFLFLHLMAAEVRIVCCTRSRSRSALPCSSLPTHTSSLPLSSLLPFTPTSLPPSLSLL